MSDKEYNIIGEIGVIISSITIVLAVIFAGISIGERLDHTLTQNHLAEINSSCEAYSVELDKNNITVNCKDGSTKELER